MHPCVHEQISVFQGLNHCTSVLLDLGVNQQTVSLFVRQLNPHQLRLESSLGVEFRVESDGAVELLDASVHLVGTREDGNR